jgi:hypothetical protein
MEIEEEGRNDPVRLARAIHNRLGPLSGPVPVREIALALDIVEICEEELDEFEAALITQPERDIGSIVVNLKSDRRRRRFSLGHELGHFLQAEHVLNQPTILCSKRDMVEQDLNAARYEVEANRFAIELLAPPEMVRPALRGVPDLEKVQQLAERLDLSFVAAARRYAELHDESLAVLVCRDSVVSYMAKGPGFPFLLAGRGSRVPLPASTADRLTSMELVDPRDWLSKPLGIELSIQTLHQRDGHSISLLHSVRETDE